MRERAAKMRRVWDPLSTAAHFLRFLSLSLSLSLSLFLSLSSFSLSLFSPLSSHSLLSLSSSLAGLPDAFWRLVCVTLMMFEAHKGKVDPNPHQLPSWHFFLVTNELGRNHLTFFQMLQSSWLNNRVLKHWETVSCEKVSVYYSQWNAAHLWCGVTVEFFSWNVNINPPQIPLFRNTKKHT